MILKSFSEKQTKNIAKSFAKNFLKKGGVIGLFGELGAGKTVFVQGFAEGLRIKDKITSPTFILIREHKIPKSFRKLLHIDLYRVDISSNLGLEEILTSTNLKDNVVLIEWPEKIESILPKDSVKIYFNNVFKNSRLIHIL